MSRGGLLVREAGPGDVEALLGLWSGWGLAVVGAARTDASEATRALALIAADPDARLLVGELGGQVVCCVHLRCAPVTPLHTEPVVHTSYLMVAPAHRKHGFAHVLLEAAVTWADELGVEHITAVTSSDRESNRFLARLGLMDVATIRASSTAALRHKLTPTPLRGASARMRVVAQRRSARRRGVGATN